jgi:hypothetical protein
MPYSLALPPRRISRSKRNGLWLDGRQANLRLRLSDRGGGLAYLAVRRDEPVGYVHAECGSIAKPRSATAIGCCTYTISASAQGFEVYNERMWWREP